MAERFTDARVPDPGVRVLFAQQYRWQCWLDVEAALAAAEAECGVIPAAAAPVIQSAHRRILRLLAGVLSAAADLAEHTAGLLAAGRTHGQHAVPITFGFKPAGWIDELDRHVTRLRSAEGRVFTAMTGGAAGTFSRDSRQLRGVRVHPRPARRDRNTCRP